MSNRAQTWSSIHLNPHTFPENTLSETLTVLHQFWGRFPAWHQQQSINCNRAFPSVSRRLFWDPEVWLKRIWHEEYCLVLLYAYKAHNIELPQSIYSLLLYHNPTIRSDNLHFSPPYSDAKPFSTSYQTRFSKSQHQTTRMDRLYANSNNLVEIR